MSHKQNIFIESHHSYLSKSDASESYTPQCCAVALLSNYYHHLYDIIIKELHLTIACPDMYVFDI